MCFEIVFSSAKTIEKEQYHASEQHTYIANLQSTGIVQKVIIHGWRNISNV